MAQAKAEYRVRFTIDPDAQFEECNGENRPLTEEEYAQNQYRACPLHPRAGSTTVSFAMGQHITGCTICGNSQYEDVPYEEYLAYYGNPNRHVYLLCEVQKKCGCCGKYEYVGGTGYIDMMDDSGELRVLDEWLTEEQIASLKLGHLTEIAREDLAEAQHG